MENKKNNVKASRMVASVFGILAGIGGMWHGIGEILQGNIAPDEIIINSWTQGPIATNMGGEPGMTIIPNLLATGLLNIVISLAVIVWATAFVQKRKGGIVLILLSITMLLTGGGFGPPLIGVLSGIAGVAINKPLTWWQFHLNIGLRRFLAVLWPWFFTACTASGVLLVIGSLVLVYFFGINNADFFVMNFFFTVLTLVLTIVMSIAYNLRNKERVAAGGCNPKP